MVKYKNMGCTAIRKQKSTASLESSSSHKEVANPYPKMARMIKIFNWKSSLRIINEVKPFLEYSSSVEVLY